MTHVVDDVRGYECRIDDRRPNPAAMQGDERASGGILSEWPYTGVVNREYVILSNVDKCEPWV